jgi:hypothetical protein
MSLVRARRGVLIVWLLLGALVLGIVALEVTDRPGAGSWRGAHDAHMLLPIPVKQLGAIEIANAGRLHRFERDAAGTWFYHGAHGAEQATHTHEPDPAAAARIEQALAVFGRTRIERDFVLDRDGASYGLSTPEILILVYPSGQSIPLAQYSIGNLAPDTVSRYVQLVGSRTVVTIPSYQVDNLTALVRSVAGPAEAGPPSAERR